MSRRLLFFLLSCSAPTPTVSPPELIPPMLPTPEVEQEDILQENSAPPPESQSTNSQPAPIQPAPPESLGKPSESLAARPSWAFDDGVNTLRYRPSWAFEEGYAPQFLGELNEQKNSGAELRDSMLVCTVKAFDAPSRDFFGDNDIALSIVIDKTTITSEDALITAPLINLSAKGSFTLRVLDRDVISSSDLLANITIKPEEEWPFTGKKKHFVYRCDAYLREELEPLVKERLQALDKAISAEPPLPPPRLSQTQPTELQNISDKLRISAEQVAALVGWSDPRLAPRIAKINDLLDIQQREFTAAVEQLYSGAIPLGGSLNKEGESSLQPSIVCDQKLSPYLPFNLPESYEGYLKKNRCVVSLRLTNLSEKNISCGVSDVIRSQVSFDLLGREIETRYLFKRAHGRINPDTCELTNGQSVEWFFALDSDQLSITPATDKTPKLLRLVLESRDVQFVQLQ